MAEDSIASASASALELDMIALFYYYILSYSGYLMADRILWDGEPILLIT